MTPIDAAKKMAAAPAPTLPDSEVCYFCQSRLRTIVDSVGNFLPPQSHAFDCPVEAWPKIVAALAAAERVVADGVLFGDVDEDQRTRYGCGGCGAEQEWQTDFPHASDCPVRGLEAALKGEPA